MQRKELHDDLDKGWSWLIMFAAFICMFVIGGLNYCVGLFHLAFLDMYHESQSKTAWAASLHTALCNLGGPASGFIMARFSLRVAVLAGASFLTLGYLLTAFSPSLQITIFTFGIISGFGQAFAWTPCMVSAGFYFKKYRNIAFGLSNAGTALGIFGIAPIIRIGRDVYGPSGLFIIICCFTLQMFVCAMLMRPSLLERESKREKRDHSSKRGSKTGQILNCYLRMLTLKPIVCMCISLLLHCCGMYIVFQYFPSYCKHEGTNPVQISYAVALIGVMSIVGRLITGLVISIRHVNEVLVYAVCIGLTGVCALTFPLYATTQAGQLVFAGLFGLFFGLPFLTATPASIIFVGVANMGIALGMIMFFGGLGSIIGPVFAGFMLDTGRTYGQTFVIAGILNLIGACVALVAFVFLKCKPNESIIVHEVDEAGDNDLENAANEQLMSNM